VNSKRILFYSSILILLITAFYVKSAEKEWSYTVSNGDNLWNISQKYLKKTSYFRKLQKLNNISYPKKLKPNSLIKIPMSWIKVYPASATVSALSGNSTYLKQGKKLTTKIGSVLNLGDTLTVDNNASVTITFADGSVITLLESSQLVFEHLTRFGKTGMVDTQLRLQYGKIETQAKKSKGPGSRLDISTGSALSSVRGTVYRVAHSQQSNNSVIEVLEGIVAVHAQQKSESITGGFATKVLKGHVPSKPISLLKAPQWQNKKVHFEGENIYFSWKKDIKANAYKIQLSTNKSFTDIVWQKKQTKNSISFKSIDDGRYFIRVSAINSSGIEGFTQQSSFTLNNAPLAPNLKKIDTLFDTKDHQLIWSHSDNTTAYFLQIAIEKNFSNTVISKTLSQPYFTIPSTLSFGKYYWRVAAINSDGKGPFSDSSVFKWQNLLSSEMWQYKWQESNVLIYWNELKINELMQIQVSQDLDFRLNTFTYESSTAEKSIRLPDGGAYIRTRVINKNSNINGKWSEVKQIINNDKDTLVPLSFLLLFILL
jgi:hypothetical protein